MNVVINYFNPKAFESLRKMVQMSIALFIENSLEEHVYWLLDGSGQVDAELADYCARNNFNYLPSSSPERFAETYNRGLKLAKDSEVVIVASDIFVTKGWDKFRNTISQVGFKGMVIPYLSSSDYSTQQIGALKLRKPIKPVACTINMNYFSNGVLNNVGLLDEDFSGSYNDIDLLLRIRRAGYEVLLMDMGLIKHLGKMTVGVSSQWNPDIDGVLFSKKYPHLASKRWWYKPYKREFCSSFPLRVILYLSYMFLPKFWLRRIMMVEVFFSKYIGV